MNHDAIRLLRLPFSIYLMPVYWYALAFVPLLAGEPGASTWYAWGASPWRAVATFLILHLLVYPASNGFNSWHDRDAGPIGGLAAPPPPPPALWPLVNALDGVALALGFLIDWRFGVLLLLYIATSRAYSAPPLRLKSRPLLGTAAVALVQGWVTYLTVQAGLGVSTAHLLSMPNLLIGAGTSLLLLGSYPLTQVYQHAEDQARGDLTLSRLLGVAGTFRFARIVSLLGAAYVMSLGWLPQSPGAFLLWNTPLPYNLRWSLLFGLWMLPTARYVDQWARRVRLGQAPGHSQAMKLNALASLSVSSFFLLTLLVQLYVLTLVNPRP